jgi:ABC-2 type transport system permease protein
MIRDLRTIIWKEWKGLFRWRGSRLRALLTLVIPLGVFGVYVPWDSGDHWLNGTPSVFAAFALPIVVALLIVPDSFAGERERHTLPTLLASRLPNRAILLGKILFSASLAWVSALFILVLGLITVNLAHGEGELLLYSPKIAIVDLGLTFFLATISVGAGILISLKASTVQEAQQLLAAVLLGVPTVLGPVVLLISKARPEWSLRNLLGDIGSPRFLVILFCILLVVDLVIYAGVMARFKRSKLILS